MVSFNPEYLERIARVCHEANRSVCESAGDMSQVSWDDAEAWQKDSAMKGVAFRINNPEAPLSAQHDSWMQEKLKDGWVYGEVKDVEAKTHPCLVPYEQLSAHDKRKDSVFVTIVNALK